MWCVRLQDFVAVFAASNDGGFGYFTVGTPGLAKNALTIGASQNPHTDIAGQTFNQTHLAFFSSLGPTFDYR